MQLDGKQSAMLSRAAALLPLAQRDDFQRSVANVLAGVEHAPRDAELRDVLRLVLAKRGVSIGAAVLLPPPQAHNETRHDRSANNFRNWRRKASSKQLQEAT